MKIIKVTVITPYDELKNLVDSVINENEYNLELCSYVGDLEEGVRLAKDAEKNGTDIIISRGGTAELIEEVVSVPVVEIEISSYDMLCVVALLKDYPGKVAMVGFPSIAEATKTICTLLDIEMDIFVIHDEEEVNLMLLELKQKGFSLIVGDVVTVEFAKSIGLGSVLLTSGRESVIRSFEEARKIFEHISLLKSKVSLYKRILQNISGGVIVLEKNGNILFRNECAIENESKWNIDQSWLEEWINIDHNKSYKISNNGKILDIDVQVEEKDSGIIIVIIKECHEIEQSHGIYIYNTLELNLIYQTNIIYKNLLNKKMNDIIKDISIYSKANTPIVIFSEKGAGKESLAVYIHQRIQSELSPLLKVDCASIDDKVWDVIDNFIDRVKDQGTLFIKNIHLTSDENKLKIMKKISSTTLNVPLIIITCLNTDGYFFDTNRFIHIIHPPLRDRIEDIDLYARLFINKYNLKFGKQIVGIRPDALDMIKRYPWYGNINQLENVFGQLCLACEKPFIELKEVKNALSNEPKMVRYNSVILEGTLEEIQEKIILKVWHDEGKNNTKAAKRLGINRSTLWRRLNNITR